MSIWNNVRGFLPWTDPVDRLAVEGETYRPLVDLVENLAANLVPLIDECSVREELVCRLREIVPLFDHDLFNSFGSDRMDERAFLVYGYFAAAYVNNCRDQPLNRLAKEITIPIVRLAERVQRKPVLDYYSYIMYNWRRKNLAHDLSVDNLEPLLTFTGTDEEKGYITSRVAVEYLVQPLMTNPSLWLLSEQLDKMLVVLQNSPVLPRSVENVFQSFVNVKYEGWGWPDPQTYNGEVATQSTLVSFVARMLGLNYADGDIRDYKPIPHRHLLDGVKNISGEDKHLHKECLLKFVKVTELLCSPQSDLVFKKFDKTKNVLISML